MSPLEADVGGVPLDKCNENGVFVVSCQNDPRADAKAELALGIFLSIDRKLNEAITCTKSGKFDKPKFSHAMGVKDQILGLVGWDSTAQKLLTIV